MPIEPTGLPTNDQQKTTESSLVKVARIEPSAAQQETQVGKSNTADTVTLTDISSKLQELGKTLSVMPIIDAQRVEDIKVLVDQGNYEIDNNKTADKLMAFELQLAG